MFSIRLRVVGIICQSYGFNMKIWYLLYRLPIKIYDIKFEFTYINYLHGISVIYIKKDMKIR
jgi:hypothetical protein